MNRITFITGYYGSGKTEIALNLAIQKKIPYIIDLDIINPEPAVIYGNNTLRQVINIINTGNKTLHGIYLGAVTNSSTAKISFSNNYINELLEGAEQKTDLIIEDYKLYNNYEIIIYANVTNPEYNDKAVIFVNALEKSRGNQSVTSTKITFARDLLSSNPECIELNEFLKKSLDLMNIGEYAEAAKVTDAVIQGCKYLVSQSKLKDESPTGWTIKMNLDKYPFIKPLILLFGVIMISGILLTIRMKKINNDSEKE